MKSFCLYCSIATRPIIAALSLQYFNWLKKSFVLYLMHNSSIEVLSLILALAPPTIPKFKGTFCLKSFLSFCIICATATFSKEAQTSYLSFKQIQDYKKLGLYRFNYLNHFLTSLGNQQLTNDIGWSCTIKSFQMLLALILCKFHQSYEIIKLIYHDKGILSIHNFVKYLNKKNLKEGVYLGSFLISNIYSQIIREYENQKLLNFNISFTLTNFGFLIVNLSFLFCGDRTIII